MEKRGQFFLIAALVIIIVLIGIGVVYNSINTQEEDKTIYDLSEEINFEATQVIDSGVMQGTGSKEDIQDQIASNLNELTESYAKANPDSEFYVVYGDTTNAHIFQFYSTDIGSVGISTGGSSSEIENIAPEKGHTEIEGKDKVKVDLGSDSTHEFSLTQNQNFYLIVKKDRGDDQIVTK